MFKESIFKSLVVGVTVALASCGPRDVAVERNGATGNSGQPVSMSSSGERSPTCPTNMTDHTSLRSPFELDQKIFSGKVTAALGAGDRNCFRVGATVNLQNGTQGDVRARVEVIKVEAFPLTSLTAAHAASFDMTADELKAFAEKEIASAPFNSRGWVNITYFKYVAGSGAVTPQSTELTVVDKDGERSPTCPTTMQDHTFLRSPLEFDDKIFAKKITASLGAGDRNCFRIGVVAELKNGAQGQVRGKVKVIKVEVVPLTALTASHASLLDMTLDELKAYAEKEVTSAPFDSKGMVHITHFAFQDEGQGAGAEPSGSSLVTIDEDGVRPATCPATFQDSSRLLFAEVQNTDVLAGKIQAQIEVGDRNCFKIGAVVSLKNDKDQPEFATAKVTQIQILKLVDLNQEQASALNLSLDDAKTLATQKAAAVTFNTQGFVSLTYFEVAGGNTDTGNTSPLAVDENFYKLLVPVLKPEIQTRLSKAMSEQGVEWDTNSLKLTFSGFIDPVDNFGIAVLPSLGLFLNPVKLPAYKVELTTQKGNSLVLANSLGEDALWVMETNVREEKVTDIEGDILEIRHKWYAPMLSPVLFNVKTQIKTEIIIEKDFSNFYISVD